MLRTSAIILTLILALQGTALAQGGIMDSIFGAGGLGLWGGGDTSQFNVQQYVGPPPQDPGQQAYQQPAMPGQQPGVPYGYPQGYPPQGYTYPQQPAAPYYGPQQGVYSDWYNQAPQDQAPSGPPPVRYSSPPGQAGPAPQAQAGPPAPRQVAPPGAPLRPGQYSPGQGPGVVDDLPAGAVRVTTTTPEGTTVQFYPPEGQPVTGQPRVQPQPRRLKAPGTAKPRQGQPREQSASTAPSGSDMSVVMPKPVEIPAGQDPRSGWAPR